MSKKDHIIIAPHPDDECIGMYEILKNEESKIIIYSGDTLNSRREIALKLRDEIPSIKLQMFHMSIPQSLINKENIFYMPDPYFEIHPKHREWGFIGEQMARQGLNVIFYSTIMNTPYIHEVKEPQEKENLLNKIYPDQSDLWKFEKKFILFEGRCQWLF